MHLPERMKQELDLAMRLMKLKPTQDRLERLWHYINLLAEWNQVMNLTRVPIADWLSRHIMDSFSILSFIPAKAKQLADIGSGGGLPAIPLALVMPDCDWTLIEKSHNKASFLLRVKSELLLDNITVVHQRAEDLVGHYSFDLITARALGSCALVCRLAWPLLDHGGWLLAMKAGVDQDELKEVEEPWQSTHSYPITIPPLHDNRQSVYFSLIVWQK